MNKVLFLPLPIPYANQETGSKLHVLRRDLETSRPQQGETGIQSEKSRRKLVGYLQYLKARHKGKTQTCSSVPQER